jgi:hypothetical protein
MFPLNTILAWNINIIMNKKYNNNNIIIASRAYFLHLGTYYLIDSGYPNRKRFLAPYKNNTYHLPDFLREGIPIEKEEIFNFVHAWYREK